MKKPYLLGCLLFTCSLTPLHAGMTMVVDVDNDNIWFTGTTGTGTFSESDGLYSAIWMSASSLASPTESLNGSNWFTTDNGATSITGHFDVRYESNLSLSVLMIGVTSTTGTFTGQGELNAFSYSGWSSTDKAYLESLVVSGTVLHDYTGEAGAGTGFGDVSIVSSSAVPEPGTCAFLLGGASIACVIFSRRRRNQ